MIRSEARVATSEVRLLPPKRACSQFAVNEQVSVLVVAVCKKDILIDASRGIDCRVQDPIERLKAIVVQWLGIQRGDMINPDPVCAENPTQLTHEGAAPTVPHEVNWQLCQGMTTKLWNKVRRSQGRRQCGCDFVGVV